uniref:G-protein coupled receptors family 1 profile domain-containing protein n=1 Tax=Canis lupus dingo TaxID=286419 RepID=A0A8C0K9C1_CANLU
MKANKTQVTEFVLTGLTDRSGLQVPLFLVFLIIYLTTMVGNLALIFLIWKDPHLHTPMYLFLGSLAFADACSSSSVTPKMLMNFLSKNHMISHFDEMSQSEKDKHMFSFIWGI